MTRVRVRGIYATALTHRFTEADLDVVQASPPIERRFDEDFASAMADATVETTDDRQGVSVTGVPDAVETVTDCLATGLDTFVWTDDAPRSAVFDAAVEETLGSGAVVSLGDEEGFLPYSNADRRVEEGDALRVQVHDPAAPWADERPVVGTDLRAVGGLVTLSRAVDSVVVAGGDDDDGRELAGLTDLLSTEVPDDWGVRWERAATDLDMPTLDGALEAAAERATALESELADAAPPEEGAPGRVAAPEATRWAWFGRASRFDFDADRRAVTTTMGGHHRAKAADESASVAVDFVEELCDIDDSFPTGAVLRRFGPSEGDRVAIGHGKPDGRLVTLGRGRVTECDPDAGTLTLRRRMGTSGVYDALGTDRERGDVAVTSFKEGRWWYPTTYRGEDGDAKGTYVNVCTAVELFPDTVRYVDLHVDVVKRPDGTVERVDDDELDAAVDAGEVAEELAEKARDVAGAVESALR